MKQNSKIFVAGHNGLVGSAIVKGLYSKGYSNIICKNRNEVNLLNQDEVKEFFEKERPEYVFMAAAKVGGIVANNKFRADFIYENLQIQNNVIHQSYAHGVKKLLFLGSTCIYPKNAPQPMKEEYLLTSELEYTNEPYAVAKIAGMKMCESYNVQYGTNFLSVMPTNLYGPNDNFDLETSHVLPAMIRKLHLAKLLRDKNFDAVLKDLKIPTMKECLIYLDDFGVSEEKVEIWGSGNPMREFLWSEDMADACIFVMENIDFTQLVTNQNINLACKADMAEGSIKEIRNTHINIGTNMDISIKDLAYLVKNVVGFDGELYFNTQKPDGTMKKLTDVSKLHSLNWKHSINLEDGIKLLYNSYIS